jgi:hypothetical protein
MPSATGGRFSKAGGVYLPQCRSDLLPAPDGRRSTAYPRTQSALLQSMQECTVAGIATTCCPSSAAMQNPIEQEDHPPEAQLDRF